jgi:hypothetical protein
MTDVWFVDRVRSHIIGTLMKGANVPVSEHPLKAERHWQIWSELVFISICHQANWDRLHDHIIEIAASNPTALEPSRLSDLRTNEFVGLFAPGLDPSRMRVNERVKLLQGLARTSVNWPNADGLLWLGTQRVTLSGQAGLYHWLSRIPVFAEDPVQKKSRVLVHQLLRYGLISVADPKHISPAVDYHLMRLYLRTGRIRPVNEDWDQRLKDGGKARVEPLTALRRGVEEAMYYTAVGAGLRVDQLNHIEWQIARSFCVREEPRCSAAPLREKPVDAGVAKLSIEAGCGCPLRVECLGARDPYLKELSDLQSVRHYY